MAVKLTINLRAREVEIGHVHRKGQWLVFYGLLADLVYSVNPEQWLTPQRLREVGAWQRKDEQSVGKEVAREIARLRSQGVADIIDHGPGLTKAWRLRVKGADIKVVPGPSALHRWITTESVPESLSEQWVNELSKLVDAAIAVNRGEAERALEALRGQKRLTEPSLVAWASLLAASARLQFADDSREAESELPVSELGGMLGDAVRDRLASFRAMANRFSSPEDAMLAIGKVASAAEARGDVATLGVLTNVLGLLYRRVGQTTAAAAQHRRAIGLSAVSNDYRTVQAAIFNLALCRRYERKQKGLPPDTQMMELAELCHRVSSHFGVGNESAQAELTIALWAAERGDCGEAWRLYQRGQVAAEQVASTWEQAYVLLMRARIALKCPRPGTNPERDLGTAARLFAKAGDGRSVERAKQLRTQARNVRRR